MERGRKNEGGVRNSLRLKRTAQRLAAGRCDDKANRNHYIRQCLAGKRKDTPPLFWHAGVRQDETLQAMPGPPGLQENVPPALFAEVSHQREVQGVQAGNATVLKQVHEQAGLVPEIASDLRRLHRVSRQDVAGTDEPVSTEAVNPLDEVRALPGSRDVARGPRPHNQSHFRPTSRSNSWPARRLEG
jgi:hypothetical protein